MRSKKSDASFLFAGKPHLFVTDALAREIFDYGTNGR